MRTEHIALPPLAPGAEISLTVHRFGQAGARPRIQIRAALHADEILGMLAAHYLREHLTALEAEGRITGEIILVPSANPIGLSQQVLGMWIGKVAGTSVRRTGKLLGPDPRRDGWSCRRHRRPPVVVCNGNGERSSKAKPHIRRGAQVSCRNAPHLSDMIVCRSRLFDGTITTAAAGPRGSEWA